MIVLGADGVRRGVVVRKWAGRGAKPGAGGYLFSCRDCGHGLTELTVHEAVRHARQHVDSRCGQAAS